MAALHLLDAGLDVVGGNQRHAVQPFGIGRAEFVHPIVVNLEGLLLRLDVVDAKQRHAVIRKQDFGGNAVGILVAHAQARIAGAGRTVAERHLRQMLAQTRREFLPERVRLHDMGVGRNHLRHRGDLCVRKLHADDGAGRKGAGLFLRNACEFRGINGKCRHRDLLEFQN